MEEITQDIKDKLQKLCLSRGTTVATVKEAIRQGHTTYDAVVEATGVTTGGCKGHRCKDKVKTLIETYKQGEWQ